MTGAAQAVSCVSAARKKAQRSTGSTSVVNEEERVRSYELKARSSEKVRKWQRGLTSDPKLCKEWKKAASLGEGQE